MPRSLDHPQLVRAQPNQVALLQEMQGPFVVAKWQIPALASGRSKIQYHFFVGVDIERKSPGLVHETVAEYMIEMAVRVKQLFGCQPGRLYKCLEVALLGRRVATRIDDQTITGLVV